MMMTTPKDTNNKPNIDPKNPFGVKGPKKLFYIMSDTIEWSMTKFDNASQKSGELYAKLAAVAIVGIVLATFAIMGTRGITMLPIKYL
jgi:hypothetical protein